LKSSALYDARQHATPSQLRALKERNERKSWFDRLAKRDSPVSCQSATARVAALPDRPKKVIADSTPSYKEVFEKASRAHPVPLPFETWFRIVPDEAQAAPAVIVSIRQIQRAVVDQFPAVSRVDICSARRTNMVVMPRQIAMYIAKVLTSKSLPDIGRMFGGRDHTTVIHAVRKIAGLIRSDPAVAQDVGEIINNLGCRDI
jgi:hypothetical protein